ncbi:MAG: HU family DNA-binding protein [Oscillospiraceae bacterium]
MTRSQLISQVSKKTGNSAALVEEIMNEIFEGIVDGLEKDEKVTVAGFGRFEMRNRKAKSYINPKTKVACQLSPTRIPGFKASGIIKDRLSK